MGWKYTERRSGSGIILVRPLSYEGLIRRFGPVPRQPGRASNYVVPFCKLQWAVLVDGVRL